MTSGRNKCPFTLNQWQQLEHQALIFKYMVSGVPIPPQLIDSVKTSSDSSLPPNLYPQQHTRWGCFQVGYGRKPDPEPGRCRRTDGKKWRCSKEAYPDSKYCERHMHRGRNRSRKPVEVNASSSSTATTGSTLSTSFPSINSSLSISSSNATSSFSFSPMTSETTYTHFDPFLYSHSSTSTKLPGPGLSVPSHHFLDPATGIDYRYVHGTRGDVDERSFFPEASGSVRVVPDPYQPLAMVQSFGEQEQQQQCFVLGTDIKSAKPIKLEKDEETQKPVHLLGDWTPRNNNNNNGSWLDLASNFRVHSDS